jgi:hypothetical protein
MTPEYILRKSLCRTPFCASPYELRNMPLKDWPADAVQSYRRSAEQAIEWMNFCSEYGEPSHTNPQKMILFADWNNFPRGVCDLLEKQGYAIEWEDEWIIDYETSKAYRTSPDCYSWQPYYWLDDNSEVIGGDLIKTEDRWRDQYVEHLTNNPRTANLFKIDFEALGFQQHNGEFETGWHPGQNGNPQKVFAMLEDKYDVVFDMHGGSSQFYTSWKVWIKEKDSHCKGDDFEDDES